MVLPIERSLREAERPYVFSIEETWPNIDFREESIQFAAPVKIEGVVTNQEDRMLLEGTITIQYHAICGRCLKPGVYTLDMPVFEVYVKEGMRIDDDADVYWYSGDAINLDDMVREQILLHYPMMQLCSEDCRGLCPVCGIDRNACDCNCQLPDDNPFAVLGNLLKE